MTINCADAITILTGHLCVSVDRLYPLYNELTGDNLFTHQLVRAGKLGQRHAQVALPGLAAHLNGIMITRDNWRSVVDETRAKFGDVFTIPVMTEWQHLGPLSELAEMVGPEKIIVCEAKRV